MIKKLLGLASALEILTGLALIIAPSGVALLLLGDGASGTGIGLGRVASFGYLQHADEAFISMTPQPPKNLTNELAKERNRAAAERT